MSGAPRVLVVDDQSIYRTGLRAVLQERDEVEYAGEAADGAAAIEACATLAPDVVLMDIRMPGVGGIEATRAITTAQPAVAVVMLTMLEDDSSLFAGLRAGARGYLLKGADPDQIIRAILAAHDGDTVIGSGAADHIASFFRADAAAAPAAFPGLTRREHDILDLVGAGLPNTQIADRLFLSEKTVRNNVSAIITKLGLPDRAAAIVTAREHGLGRR